MPITIKIVAFDSLYFFIFFFLLIPLLFPLVTCNNHGVFSVKYRYAGTDRSLVDLKAHDTRRELRLLAGVDIWLGGNSRPDGVGLYYAKVGIGTPSKDYYVQVDTGSDLMWVNCIQCKECPKRSSLGIDLTLYNFKDSLTGELVYCDQRFCSETNRSPISECKANMTCTYFEGYGDGSSTAGYFVNDLVQYDAVSGDLNTSVSNGSIIFGCGAQQSGSLESEDRALDGIFGFGKANSSVISQLASSGKVKKMFAHCLNGVKGGGIFAIGHVVQPVVNTTPLVPNQPHYNINMKAVAVGHEYLNISADIFGTGNTKGTIIDSGTTLAYLPQVVYEPLVDKIFSQQTDLKLRTVHDQYTCFPFDQNESVDVYFPNVTFHFENSLVLNVLPHDYLFPMDGLMCIGWQNRGNQSVENKNLFLLGDLVLSNKLVLYDLEKQVIGWTEYNCSSSIKVKDEQTGIVHLVGSHYIPSVSIGNLNTERFTIILFLLIMMLHLITW